MQLTDRLLRALPVLLAFLSQSLGCNSRPPGTVDPAEPSRETDAWFQEQAAASGIDFIHAVGDPASYDMPQIMGSGGALVDLDLDGCLEVLLTGDRQIAYYDNHDGRFRGRTASARLTADAFGMGITAADLNADGFGDLYLTSFGPDALWINNGDGTFTRASDTGVSNVGWGTAACVFDDNRDGLPDLFVVNYVDYIPGQWCEDSAGRQEFCGPASFTGTVDRLFRNAGYQTPQGDPVFADVTIETGLATNPGKGLGVASADLTGDGRTDLYVANDMESNHLWVRQSDGSYLDEALWRGTAFNGLGDAEASMGTILADLDGDQREELFLTHLRGESHTLYAPLEAGQFQDVTARSGLATVSLPFTGFGVACADFECDGDIDLAIANGRVRRAPRLDDCTLDDPWCDYAEPNHLFLNDGTGRFVEATSEGGLFSARIEVSRGLAQGDCDNDGDVDLLLTNCGGQARLYVNQAVPRGNWLMVRLVDPFGERNGISARVTLYAGETALVRRMSPGTGYLTTSDFRLHFGLSEHDEFDHLIVEWPDGVVEDFPGGPVNRHLLVCRGGRILNARQNQ